MRNDLAVLVAAWGLALAGCTALHDPRPGPIRAMEPRPNPPIGAEARPAGPESASVQERVRRNPWLARFWEELSPAQRRRVAAGMRRATSGQEEPAARWDVMGLEERAALVFGGGPRPVARPAVAAALGEAVAAAPELPIGPARPAAP
jgi:hypothetical protein